MVKAQFSNHLHVLNILILCHHIIIGGDIAIPSRLWTDVYQHVVTNFSVVPPQAASI